MVRRGKKQAEQGAKGASLSSHTMDGRNEPPYPTPPRDAPSHGADILGTSGVRSAGELGGVGELGGLHGADALGTSGISQQTLEILLERHRIHLGAILGGRYRLDQELGRGGMGVVYLAMDRTNGELCAIKILHPHLEAAALEKEFEIVKALEHPSIVKVHRLIREQDYAFLVMEYLAGRSLDRSFEEAEKKRIPYLTTQRALLDLLDPLVEALAYAHSKGIIHRDLKPANLLVVPQGQIKILDFGIAKQASLQTTILTSRVGTPFYMAPEQLTLGSKATPSVSLYAVGAILYQALTGSLPYGRLKPPSEVLRGDTAPPFFGEAMDQAILRALEPDPSQRYESIRAMQAAIHDALADFAVQKVKDSQAAASTQALEVKRMEREAKEALKRQKEAEREAQRQEKEAEKRRLKEQKKSAISERVARRRAWAAMSRPEKQAVWAGFSPLYKALREPSLFFWWRVALWGALFAMIWGGGVYYVVREGVWSFSFLLPLSLLMGAFGGLMGGLAVDQSLQRGTWWMAWAGLLWAAGLLLYGSVALVFWQSLAPNASASSLRAAFQGVSWIFWLSALGMANLLLWWLMVTSARAVIRRGFWGIFVSFAQSLFRSAFFCVAVVLLLEIATEYRLSLWQRYPFELLSLGACVVFFSALFSVGIALVTLWHEYTGSFGSSAALAALAGLLLVLPTDIRHDLDPYRLSRDGYYSIRYELRGQIR